MEQLDTTILNTAVPTIAEALKVAPLSMKSVLASYTLSLAVFIPISGWMADRFGTRRVFSSAIGLFTLGSLLCGLSTNIHALVACRILARLRRSHDGSRRPPHPGAHLRQIRTRPRDELRLHPRPHRPHARAHRRRPYRRLLPLASHLLRQPSHRPRRPGISCICICPTTARSALDPLDVDRADSLRLRHRAALLRARGLRRAHAEHRRNHRPAGHVLRAAGRLRPARLARRAILCCL